MGNKKIKSEKQHILEFYKNFVHPIAELDFDSEVSFIDFLILDKQTQRVKMCIEFKKDASKKEKMFAQLQNTRGIKAMTDYAGFYGAVNSTHFYIKDNEWADVCEFELKEVAKIQKWLRNNLIDEDVVIDWNDVFEKCGFVLADADLFDKDGITYEKVLAAKNKYIQDMFSFFTVSFGGVNVDLSFAEMFLNELGVSNTLSRYKKKELEFNNVVLEDGFKEYLQLHYQELIFEHHQRKSQGAFYTKLNVTGLMWEMIRKHINIDEYYIWDPCCGTGNLFKDTTNEVFDFIDKDRLYLSDIDITAVNICKQDKGFNANNVFGYNYQQTINNNFIDEQCFQFDYQNTIIDNFTGMPSKLQKIIKETPEKLFVVCNPPYLNLGGKQWIHLKKQSEVLFHERYKTISDTIINLKFREKYGWDTVCDLYRQYMIWTNEGQIRKTKKCYIVPIGWMYQSHRQNSMEKIRQNLNQNFFDAFVISNCEFENVNRFDPIGVFLVGNDKGNYSWKDLNKIPVILPADKTKSAKFIKEMNKINAKYNLKKYIPGLLFEFEE